MPSPTLAANVLGPYNAIFSLSRTTQNVDVRFIYDNESCYNLYRSVHKQQRQLTTYYHVNHLIARVLSGISGCTRYDSQLDFHLNQFPTNLVPFPNCNMVILFLKIIFDLFVIE